MRWRQRLEIAAVAALIVAYAVLSHYANSRPPSRDLSVAVSLGPVLGLGLLVLWRGTHAVAALGTGALAALAAWYCWPLLVANFRLVYLTQESGFYGLMAASFALSLREGRIALCTMIADKVHGPLSAAEVTYTRRVTAAWALFFVTLTAATAAFYELASLETWSFFANFCVIPLMALVLVIEYAIRRRVLPQVDSRGMLAGVRMYFATSRKAAP